MNTWFSTTQTGLFIPDVIDTTPLSSDKNTIDIPPSKNFSLYILDFDGNILQTETPIYLLNKSTNKIEAISTYEHDQNPEKYFHPESDFVMVNHSYMEARENFPHADHRGFNWLTSDISRAIEQWEFAPSFEIFKKIVLIEARVFSILTARGNSPDNFERGFTLLTNSVLSPEEKERQRENIIQSYRLPIDTRYEDALHFYMTKIATFIPCNNPHVERFLDLWTPENLAERKAKATSFIIKNTRKTIEKLYPEMNFHEFLNGRNFSIGFSDDSKSNAVAVYKKFEKIIKKNDWIPKKMSVFFTGKESERENVLRSTNAENYKIKNGALKLKVTKK